jgi:pimeloyl-ACP methyl ester carboxylesterase
MPQLRREGISLFYTEAGQGSPSVVLLHPYGGDNTYMSPQFEHFRQAHRVIAPDLRGHGQSDKPHAGYTIATFADDVAWLCNQLDVRRCVVVGHSMGGMVALQLAAAYPELPSTVVILDSPVVTPTGLMDGFRPLLDGLRTAAYQEATKQFYTYVSGFDDRPERKARIVEGMASNAQHVLVASMEGVLAADTDAAAAACKIPVLYVSSGPWYTDVVRFKQLCPQLVTGQTVGSGHFHQLEVPVQVNAMIERFLKLSLPSVVH